MQYSKEQPMRLAIGGPTRDSVPASFAVNACELYAYTRELGPWGRDVSIGWIASTYIHVGREHFLEAALKQGATHVLWIDTDMGFPRSAAVQLMAHGMPIVGCNYVVRQESRLFTARRHGERIATFEHSKGLEEVDELGMGLLFMDASVVADLPRPWFRHGMNEQGGDIGEDIVFCRALRAAGHTIYLDHDLSKEVDHVGQHPYSYADPPALALTV
jgi:hypothetical protein